MGLCAPRLPRGVPPAGFTPLGAIFPQNYHQLGKCTRASALRAPDVAPRDVTAALCWAPPACGARPPQPPRLLAPLRGRAPAAGTQATRGSEGSAATRVFPEPMSLSAGRGLGPPSVRHAPTQLDEGQPRGGLRARLSVVSLFVRISGPTTGLCQAPPCRDGRKPAPEIRPSSERTASLAKH